MQVYVLYHVELFDNTTLYHQDTVNIVIFRLLGLYVLRKQECNLSLG